MSLSLKRLLTSFNTQPPEGGWSLIQFDGIAAKCFNTQPPEGGWVNLMPARFCLVKVSTHSRLKAAGLASQHAYFYIHSFQHTAA